MDKKKGQKTFIESGVYSNALAETTIVKLEDPSTTRESISISQLKRLLHIGKFKAMILLLFFVIIGFAKLEIKDWRFNLSERGIVCVNEMLFEKKCNQCKLKRENVFFEGETSIALSNPPRVTNVYNITNVYNNIYNDYRFSKINLYQAAMSFSTQKAIDFIDLLFKVVPIIMYLLENGHL